MKCPRDSVELTRAENKTTALYHCLECGGLWIPKKSLIIRASDGLPEDFFSSIIKETREDIGVYCPHDRSVMGEYCYQGIAIDICSLCHGVWFDHSEYGNLLHKIGMDLDKKDKKMNAYFFILLDLLLG